jgi:DNA-binding NarL/FixJ family response regulator
MKCPYMRRQVQQTRQHKQDLMEYIPENDAIAPVLLAANDTDVIIFDMMMECIQGECAAWQNGHCVRTS